MHFTGRQHSTPAVALVTAGTPLRQRDVPESCACRPHVFRNREFPDVRFAYTIVDGQTTELRQADPSGEYRFTRAQAR
jgi:hypothetical protein